MTQSEWRLTKDNVQLTGTLAATVIKLLGAQKELADLKIQAALAELEKANAKDKELGEAYVEPADSARQRFYAEAETLTQA